MQLEKSKETEITKSKEQLVKTTKIELTESKETSKEQKELPDVSLEDHENISSKIIEKSFEKKEIIADVATTTPPETENMNSISSSSIVRIGTPSKESNNLTKSSPLKVKLVSPKKTPLSERKEFMQPIIDENNGIIDFR